jgi:hypothetical protein
MRQRRRRVLPRLLALFLLLAFAGVGAFWFGFVPQRYSPFAPLSLEEPGQWFLDPKLAALRRDPDLCHAVLKAPHVDAIPVADNPIKNGCGWVNSVRVASAGGAAIGLDKVSCEMAAALTLWIEHELQPLAQEILGTRVVGIDDMGTYACRNIVGRAFWKDFRSQHATANAIDIAGFRLADKRHISVVKSWKQPEAEARFLREAHRRACRYFRVSLGPDFNAAHRDHLHYDRGIASTCR